MTTPTQVNKDIPSSYITYFLREMYLPETDVAYYVQLFTSDFVYRVFYGTKSQFNKLTTSGDMLDDKLIIAAITTDGKDAITSLLAFYPEISSATFSIDSSYINATSIYIDMSLALATKQGDIVAKKTVKLGR